MVMHPLNPVMHPWKVIFPTFSFLLPSLLQFPGIDIFRNHYEIAFLTGDRGSRRCCRTKAEMKATTFMRTSIERCITKRLRHILRGYGIDIGQQWKEREREKEKREETPFSRISVAIIPPVNSVKTDKSARFRDVSSPRWIDVKPFLWFTGSPQL